MTGTPKLASHCGGRREESSYRRKGRGGIRLLQVRADLLTPLPRQIVQGSKSANQTSWAMFDGTFEQATILRTGPDGLTRVIGVLRGACVLNRNGGGITSAAPSERGPISRSRGSTGCSVFFHHFGFGMVEIYGPPARNVPYHSMPSGKRRKRR
jgi:hypothetical protein